MAKNNHGGAAKALILFKGKYLLLLRNNYEDIAPSQWDIPGGGIELGESFEQALIREVKEEAGMDISSSKIIPIRKWQKNKNGVDIGGLDFLCLLSSFQKVILSAEHTRLQWLSGEEISNNTEIPDWIKEDAKLAAGYGNGVRSLFGIKLIEK